MENETRPREVKDIGEYKKKKETSKEVKLKEARREIRKKLQEFKAAFKPEVKKLEEKAKDYFRETRLLKQRVTFKPENYLKVCQKTRKGPVSLESIPEEPIPGEDIYYQIFEEEEKYDSCLEYFDALRKSWHGILFLPYQRHRDQQLAVKSPEFLLLEKTANITMFLNKEALKESIFTAERIIEDYGRLLDSI